MITQIIKLDIGKRSDHVELEKCKVALQANHKVKWCVDSGCSKHMTGRKQFFLSLDERKEGMSHLVMNNQLE